MAIEEALAIAAQHNSRHGALIEQSRDRMARTFASTVDNPSNLALIDFIESATALDSAYRDAAALMAVDFARNYEQAITDELPPEVVDLDAVRNSVRNGLEPQTLWARPLIRTRALLARGDDLETALAKASLYAGDLQAANTSLASRAGAAAAMAGSRRTVGYRRITDGNACAYCLLASTQRYTVGFLLPIHGSSCHCTVAPIIGNADPGRVIDRELLGALKAEGIKGKPSEAARKLMRVETHGELGPTIVPARQAFTGPAGLPQRARKAVPAPIKPAALLSAPEAPPTPVERARLRRARRRRQ